MNKFTSAVIQLTLNSSKCQLLKQKFTIHAHPKNSIMEYHYG